METVSQTLRALKHNQNYFSSVIEYVTPYKLCVAIFLHEYLTLKYFKYREPSSNDPNESGYLDPKDENFMKNVSFKSIERKEVCRLLLKLLHNVDMPLSELAKEILQNPEYHNINSELKACWKRKLDEICSDPVSGLMNLMSSLEKMPGESHTTPILHRHSVCGIFLRKILLGFEKLSFSEVSNFSMEFRDYYFEGLEAIAEHNEESERLDHPRIIRYMSELTIKIKDLVHRQKEQLSHMNFNENDDELYCGDDYDMIRYIHKSKWTKKLCDMYISKQVKLLQTSESHADSPEVIKETVDQILNDNPDLPQVHYLAYLNSLRLNDYCAAIKSLYKSFDQCCTSAAFKNPEIALDNDRPNDESDRYAALNLAAMHARFGHQEEAFNALNEAIMMAQEANDHLCLQHALMWLFRIQPKQHQLLMQRCIPKCNSLGLSYLTSLGVQSLAQINALDQNKGGSVAQVMEFLSKSDMNNCQHSLIELILTSYAQKSALWNMYGRGYLSSTVSQLLLNLDSSTALRHKVYSTGEAEVIAIANVAKRLYDQGYGKECDLVLEFAKSLFPQESSLCGSIWRYTQIHIEIMRALHQTDWTTVEYYIETSLAYAKHPSEPLFLKLQLYLCQGNDLEASEVCQELSSMYEDMTAIDKVQTCLYQAELFCLTGNYPNAITPLMSAMKITAQNKLDFFHALVTLHTAHLQLQLGLSSRALKTVQSCLPMILGQASLFECSRARVLLAKCLVASCNGSRVNTFKAIEHLRKAYKDFMLLRAHHRAKDVLYLMARLYHILGVYEERNHVSAELKRLEDQYCTNGASQLAIML